MLIIVVITFVTSHLYLWLIIVTAGDAHHCRHHLCDISPVPVTHHCYCRWCSLSSSSPLWHLTCTCDSSLLLQVMLIIVVIIFVTSHLYLWLIIVTAGDAHHCRHHLCDISPVPVTPHCYCRWCSLSSSSPLWHLTCTIPHLYHTTHLSDKNFITHMLYKNAY